MLHLSRRQGESFSVFSAAGERLLQVTVVRGGSEPRLSVEGRRELIIRRDEGQGSGFRGRGPGR